MAKNFITTSTSFDTSSFIVFKKLLRHKDIFGYVGLSENSSGVYCLSDASILPSQYSSLTSARVHNIRNDSEHQSFFHDDFHVSRLSTISRW